MVRKSKVYSFLRKFINPEFDTVTVVNELEKKVGGVVIPKEPTQVKIRDVNEATKLSFSQQQIDIDFLKLAFPANTKAGLKPWVKPTQEACVKYGIDTHREVCSFLANINVETNGLTDLSENLNYSVKALLTLFGRHRISVKDANKYGRGNGHPAFQEKLANILYGGPWGKKNLGNIQAGDGWKFKGYGPKQLTGRDNQTNFARAIGKNVNDIPAFVRTYKGGMESAAWFWKSHDMDAKAATPGLRDDRKTINGGYNGLPQVEKIFSILIEELIRREG